jgi:hypothetical protein
MAVGDIAKPILPGYVAMGREATWGTYASATSAVEAISCGFKTEIDSEKLDTIGMNRGFSKRVQLNKNVGGDLETYLHPVESVLLIANTMGGPLVSTQVTSSAAIYAHSITAGNFNTSTAILGLSFNVRKGDAHTWRYNGGRVNSMKISAAVGEPVKCTFEMIFKDSTLPSDDISAILSVSSILPMTFVNGYFSYSDTEANADTTTAREPIQSFELEVVNNLASEEGGRELGTNLITQLPGTRREVNLTINQRFDTSTAYNRFLQATIGAAQLLFQNSVHLNSGTAAALFPEIRIRMPKVYQNSNDPVMDSAGNILSSEFSYDVMVDNAFTTTGKDIGITVQNGIASY